MASVKATAYIHSSPDLSAGQIQTTLLANPYCEYVSLADIQNIRQSATTQADVSATDVKVDASETAPIALIAPTDAAPASATANLPSEAAGVPITIETPVKATGESAAETPPVTFLDRTKIAPDKPEAVPPTLTESEAIEIVKEWASDPKPLYRQEMVEELSEIESCRAHEFGLKHSEMTETDYLRIVKKYAPNAPIFLRTPIVTDEKAPTFPQMSGVLWDLAQVMFPDIPLPFKFMSLVTYWGLIRSGIDTLVGEHHQCRFYTCLIGEKWTGKGASMNEAERVFSGLHPPTMVVVKSVDSAPSLCDDFADLQKLHPMAERLQVLISADEMIDLFEKAKQTAQSRNTIATTLLSCYESNTVSNRARQSNKGKRTQIEIAHLAVLGGTTPDGYNSMWQKTGGGANGLQSRFVPIYVEAKPMPAFPRQSAQETATCLLRLAELVQKPGQTIQLTPDAEKVFVDWWTQYRINRRDSATRVLDLVKRMIIVLAVTNEHDDLLAENAIYVEPSLVKMACQFGDYVVQVREQLNPTDSYTYEQAFSNGIVDVLKRHPDRPLTQREVRQLLNTDRKPGGVQSFMQAWANRLRAGDIVQVGVTRSKSPLFGLANEP